MNIENVEIGQGQPCRFVAEISNNHNGDFARALRLITAAKDAGADFVKFQCYTPQELIDLRGDGPAPEPWGSQGWSMRQLYRKASTPLEWFPDLFHYARDLEIVPFSSVFGLESLVVLESVKCPAYKIARLDNQSKRLIDTASAQGKPVIISSYDRHELVDYNSGVMRLFCPPGYPPEIKDVCLPLFDRWKIDNWNFIGLSSHCLAPELPVAAVARGCKLIEMHFMLGDEPSELESEVSLTEHEYRDMVDSVRATEAMLA